MEEKPIYLQELFPKHFMRYIGSLIWGAVLGAAAVMIHNAFVPVGLIIAVLGTGVGIWLIGRAWGMRRYRVLAALVWGYVALRGGLSGVGGELLVQGNNAGNTLIYAGVATLALAIALPV